MIPKKGASQKKYIVLQKQIDKLKEKIEKDKILNDHKYRALEEFVRLLSSFVSHDIKNSIHNIDGLIENMKVREIRKTDLNDLSLCVESLKSQMLEFTSFSDETIRQDFELYKLLTSLESLHRPIFRKNKIEFKIEYEQNAKTIMVKQNFHNLLQALNNIILNSTKAIINETTPKIDLKIIKDKDNIVIRIKDNGIGIPEENKERIFKPYFTTSTGSGVGLTHVRFTTDNINGSVKLISSIKGNTVFEVKFPIIYNEA